MSLKPRHYAEAEACPAAGAQAGLWLEVRPENHMIGGRAPLHWLKQIRRN